MTPLQYKIASGPSVAILEDQVNKMLKEGWSLQGGVNGFTGGDGYYSYYQAMVRPCST